MYKIGVISGPGDDNEKKGNKEIENAGIDTTEQTISSVNSNISSNNESIDTSFILTHMNERTKAYQSSSEQHTEL